MPKSVPEEVPSCPERVLLGAVLERAFWDLDYVRVKETVLVRSAVSWFVEGWTGRISWQTVRDNLPLTPSRAARIARRVSEAQAYLATVELNPLLPLSPGERARFAIERGHEVGSGVMFRSGNYQVKYG